MIWNLKIKKKLSEDVWNLQSNSNSASISSGTQQVAFEQTTRNVSFLDKKMKYKEKTEYTGKKITITDGGSTALWTAYTLFTLFSLFLLVRVFKLSTLLPPLTLFTMFTLLILLKLIYTASEPKVE